MHINSLFKHVLGFAGMIFTVVLSFSQTVEIVVADKISKEALKGVTLIMAGQEFTSNGQGIINVENGLHQPVVLYKPGYYTQNHTIVSPKDTVFMDPLIEYLPDVKLYVNRKPVILKNKRKRSICGRHTTRKTIFGEGIILRFKDTSLFEREINRIRFRLKPVYTALKPYHTLIVNTFKETNGVLTLLQRDTIRYHLKKDKYFDIIPRRQWNVDKNAFVFYIFAPNTVLFKPFIPYDKKRKRVDQKYSRLVTNMAYNRFPVEEVEIQRFLFFKNGFNSPETTGLILKNIKISKLEPPYNHCSFPVMEIHIK